MFLAHCILGKFLGVGCYCFPPPLDVPTFSTRCIHVQRRGRPLGAEGGTLRGREMFRQISSRSRLPRNSRDPSHAANLRHGTDGLTFPPKEGVLRIFSPLKIRRLRPGLNPRTWVPKASTLPLDHRSRYVDNYVVRNYILFLNWIVHYVLGNSSDGRYHHHQPLQQLKVMAFLRSWFQLPHGGARYYSLTSIVHCPDVTKSSYAHLASFIAAGNASLDCWRRQKACVKNLDTFFAFGSCSK